MVVAADRQSLKAPAKVNLSLHVLGRRPDGYHELSGLVAFADLGDRLTLEQAAPGDAGRLSLHKAGWRLSIEGPFASELGASSPDHADNLVVRAARLFCRLMKTERGCAGHIRLQKNLPVAAGLGGGASDAAAILRLLQRLHRGAVAEEKLLAMALQLGADVPMCLNPSAKMIAGVGEITRSVAFASPLAAVLVNPGIQLSTRSIFSELSARSLGGSVKQRIKDLPDFCDNDDLLGWLKTQRNDLQDTAVRRVPVIGRILEALEETSHVRLARMSGSGASCFALYDCQQHSLQAARHLVEKYPQWWIRATLLG